MRDELASDIGCKEASLVVCRPFPLTQENRCEILQNISLMHLVRFPHMLGLKSLQTAFKKNAAIEVMHIIKKGQTIHGE